MSSEFVLYLNRPELLWGLPLLVVALLWLGLRSKYNLSSRQKALSLTLRLLMALCLALALTDVTLLRPEHRTATVFVLDISESISDSVASEAMKRVEQACENMGPQDRGAIVLFGQKAYLWQPLLSKKELNFSPPQWKFVRQMIGPQGTNVEEALSFASSLFPPGFERQIVLLSDGWENQGQARKEAAILKKKGITLWFWPLIPPEKKGVEVQVLSLRLSESQVYQGEAVKIEFHLFSSQDTEVEVLLERNGKKLASKKLTLQKGAQGPFSLQDVPPKKGLYLYRLQVHQKQDKTPENNEAYAPLRVLETKLRVLLVQERQEEALPLIQGLAKEGILTDWIRPSGLGPVIYQYDVVILADVSVHKLHNDEEGYSSDDLMTLLRDYVESGGGFIMIGGPNSFGLGGYMGTTIEKILPVKMDIPKKIEIPSIGMVLVIDKSGSMGGAKMELAKEAAAKVVELLKPQDWIGVVAFDVNYYWAVPLRQAMAKEGILRQIRRIRASGGTYIYPALYQAYLKLKALPQAKIRHIILLTDGRTQRANHKQLCQAIVASGITLSTVAVGRGADIGLLRNMARWGKGRFYFTRNFRNIPRIFAQETIRVSKSSIVDEPFQPIVGLPVPFLKGLDWEAAPELLSYVVTRPKKTAIVPLFAPAADPPEGRPLLAVWQYGLGRTAAFTSDATSRWAALWLDWEGYPKFWSQLIRHLAKKRSHGNFRLYAEVQGEGVRLFADGATLSGEYVNGKKLKVAIYPFEGAVFRREPIREIELRQVAPGRYEGRISHLPRNFFVARLYEGKGELDSTVFTTSAPTEKLTQGWNERFLAHLDGKRLNLEERAKLWRQEGTVLHRERQPLWHWLVLLALLLLPLDIAVRRLRLGGVASEGLSLEAALPMRKLEVAIRLGGALLGGTLFAGLAYLLVSWLPLPVLWLETEGWRFSLTTGLAFALLGGAGAWLGWKYILRERMF